MKRSTLVFILIIAILAPVDGQKKKPKITVKSTLRNLQKILVRMREFVWELRELKDVLHGIQNNNANKAEAECCSCTVSKTSITNKGKQKENVDIANAQPNSDCTKSTCKDRGTNNKVIKVEKSKYSELVKMNMDAMFQGLKTREKRCKYFCKNYEKEKIKNDPRKIVSDSKGDVIKNCGKKIYFLSVRKVDAQASIDFCCERGMQSATVDNKKDLKCIASFYRANKGKRIGDLVSSGYLDLMLNREFYSCADNDNLQTNLWMPGQPDNKDGNEPSAGLRLSLNGSQSVGYEDISSVQQVYPLCEM